ncbi:MULTISPECIES: kinase [unclassified Streptococcus]|uniref:kinase n=1 Tax=unclassified Streptococcus TaxID=2608887 RepID=UPI001071A51D|nr:MULTISPECIES: kinase [unclassified Streptococcus]MBF0787374.1 kinase [Streptococcus sp. 19428wC2_LYSM12]MCQ9211087.1 kinase [Streptococcus sp. B01]MCQ9214362.1 kinase [Streptococcus sp. O1]TFV05718.1 AAA family ATPase [Streptococcus sp. LYSM12]
MATLVIIRGNSGSGKTSLSEALQEHYGRRTLLISQDNVRRTMLREKVEPGNLSILLTETIARFGHAEDLLVIIEGFYEAEIYGEMLARLRDLFAPRVFVYYYDIPFEETVKRHATRAKKDDFTAADMKRWWIDKDYLGWEEETFFTAGIHLEAACEMICKKIEDKHGRTL